MPRNNTPSKLAVVFGWLAVASFLQTAIGHALAFGKLSDDPALWFVFPAQQLSLAGIVTVVLRRGSAIARPILFCAALAPLFESILIVGYLGPIAPFYLVLLSGVLPLIASILHPPRSSAGPVG